MCVCERERERMREIVEEREREHERVNERVCNDMRGYGRSLKRMERRKIVTCMF